MTDGKLAILYTIKGIQPYDRIKGYVIILLVPVDKLNVMELKKKNNMNVVGMMGPGGPIPQEVLQQLEDMFGNMPGMKSRGIEDDRRIVLIEEEMTFQKRGWKYNDTIIATFEKAETTEA